VIQCPNCGAPSDRPNPECALCCAPPCTPHSVARGRRDVTYTATISRDDEGGRITLLLTKDVRAGVCGPFSEPAEVADVAAAERWLTGHGFQLAEGWRFTSACTGLWLQAEVLPLGEQPPTRRWDEFSDQEVVVLDQATDLMLSEARGGDDPWGTVQDPIALAALERLSEDTENENRRRFDAARNTR
jgi:hypothetical protein